MRAVVLTIDQRGSSREAATDRVEEMLAAWPGLAMLRRFERTAGDEFQGVLKSLGYTIIADELATAGQVHSLENTMTMVHVLHDHFARLDLWFEPTEVRLRRHP